MGYIGNQNFDIIETKIGDVTGKATEAIILAKPSVNNQLWIGTDTGDLYLGDGSGWNNIGKLKGDNGLPGPAGADGKGIISISRSAGDGSAGSLDEYTISYSDSSTSVFTVQNGIDGVIPVKGVDYDDGRGIVSLVKTNTTGEVDEYTVTYTDATTFVYNVVNGIDGLDGGLQINGSDTVANIQLRTGDATNTVFASTDTKTLYLYDGVAWHDIGTAGSTGDLLKANNLADVSDKVVARTNLAVYSKSEVDNAIVNIDISSKADKADTYSKTEVDNAIAAVDSDESLGNQITEVLA